MIFKSYWSDRPNGRRAGSLFPGLRRFAWPKPFGSRFYSSAAPDGIRHQAVRRRDRKGSPDDDRLMEIFEGSALTATNAAALKDRIKMGSRAAVLSLITGSACGMRTGTGL